jgi:hypothetical protein
MPLKRPQNADFLGDAGGRVLSPYANPLLFQAMGRLLLKMSSASRSRPVPTLLASAWLCAHGPKIFAHFCDMRSETKGGRSETEQ